MSGDNLALTLSVVGLVPSVFGASLPPIASVHRDVDDGSTQHGLICATVTAAALVFGVGIAAKSPQVLVAGGAAVVAFHQMYARAAVA